jgi:hypothetical protein
MSASVAEKLGLPSNLPRAPKLSFVNYNSFGKKIASLGKKSLLEYHEITKYRIEIAEYCLKLLLDNYNNDIVFVAGLTGFLVQAKASLDSLCQEINLYCELNIGQRSNATDTEELTEPHNLMTLSKKNVKLSQFVAQELSASNPWFATFMILRDSEGVHKRRSPRIIPLGIAPHDIQVGDKKIAEFCVESHSRINQVTEESYGLMT